MLVRCFSTCFMVSTMVSSNVEVRIDGLGLTYDYSSGVADKCLLVSTCSP